MVLPGVRQFREFVLFRTFDKPRATRYSRPNGARSVPLAKMTFTNL